MIDTIKDLLKKTFKVYKNNFLRIIAIILLVWLPLVVINAVLIEPAVDLDGVTEILTNKDLQGTPEYQDAEIIYTKKFFSQMAMLFVISLLGMVSQIGIIKIAGESQASDFKKISSGVSDVFSESVALLPRTMWIAVLTGLLVSVGFMMFILPGIYMYVLSSLAVSAAVLAGVKGMQAVRTSFITVKKEVFTVAVSLFLFLIITGGVAYGLNFLASLVPDGKIITAVLGSAVTIIGEIITAFQVIFFALFFADRYKALNTERQQDKDLAEEL